MSTATRTRPPKPADTLPSFETWPHYLRALLPQISGAIERLAEIRRRESELAADVAGLEKRIAERPAREVSIEDLARAALDGRPTNGKISTLRAGAQEAQLAETRTNHAIAAEMVRLQSAEVDRLRAEAPNLLATAAERETRMASAQVANDVSLLLGSLSRLWQLVRLLDTFGVSVPAVALELGPPDDSKSPIARAAQSLRERGYKV